MKKLLVLGAVATLFTPLFSRMDDRDMHRDDKMMNKDFRFWEKNDPKWYVGFGGVVWDDLSFELQDVHYELHDSTRVVKDIQGDQKSPGAGFLGVFGYQVNKIVSAEFFYRQSVWDQKYDETETHTPDPKMLNNKRTDKTQCLSFGPRAFIAVPIHDMFAPYFIASFEFGYMKMKSNYADTANRPTTNTFEAKGWSVDYAQGFGIRSMFGDMFGARLEYTTTFNGNLRNALDLILFCAF